MLYTKYESSRPCSFRQEDFWKFHFKNLFIDPVTYLCNQLEWFEQLWYGTTQGSFLWSLVKIQWVVSERRCLGKKVYARRTTTDDGQRPVTIAHPEHFVSLKRFVVTQERHTVIDFKVLQEGVDIGVLVVSVKDVDDHVCHILQLWVALVRNGHLQGTIVPWRPIIIMSCTHSLYESYCAYSELKKSHNY